MNHVAITFFISGRKLHQQFKKKNDANMDLYKIEAAKMIQDSPVNTDLFVPVSASHNQSTVHLKKRSLSLTDKELYLQVTYK